MVILPIVEVIPREEKSVHFQILKILHPILLVLVPKCLEIGAKVDLEDIVGVMIFTLFLYLKKSVIPKLILIENGNVKGSSRIII